MIKTIYHMKICNLVQQKIDVFYIYLIKSSLYNSILKLIIHIKIHRLVKQNEAVYQSVMMFAVKDGH